MAGAETNTVVTLADAYNMAVRAYQAGEMATAASVCYSILGATADHPDTLHLLGMIRLAQGDPAGAADHVARSLRGKQSAVMLSNYGVALSMLGRWPAAIAAHRASGAWDPGNPAWYHNIGIGWQSVGRVDLALAAFGRALRLDPTHAGIHDVRARLLFGCNRFDGAAAAFRAALVAAPANADVMSGLGVALTQLSQPEAAYTWHQRALLLDPNRLDDAVHALDHDRAGLRFDRLESSRDRLAAALRGGGAAAADWKLLASVLYRDLYRPLPDDLRVQTQGQLESRLTAMAAGRAYAHPLPQPVPTGSPVPRLRIGYLSAHLKNHPIGQVTLSAFAAHDRRVVEVHGLLRGGVDPSRDPYAARHRQGFDAVHDLSGLAPDAAAERIRALSLDILVYLDGYMDKDGMAILLRRPAPVRVYWLGHAGGIGAACTDYLLADRIVVPPGEERLYGEQVVRLPNCYHCADRHPLAPEPPSRASQGLPDDAVVFCGFNNVEKIDVTAFTAWMAILRRVDRSVLWLSGSERPAANLRRFAAEQGVDPTRIVFAGRVADKGLHLARYRLADVFLDTWTMNASTTALDALWAGLPMVALKGDRFTNRISNSMLAAVGMGELVCPDVPAYIALAEALARNPAVLATLRTRLIANLQTMPLFDIDAFARKLEAVYARMWMGWQAGLPPQGFDLDGVERYGNHPA